MPAKGQAGCRKIDSGSGGLEPGSQAVVRVGSASVDLDVIARDIAEFLPELRQHAARPGLPLGRALGRERLVVRVQDLVRWHQAMLRRQDVPA